MPLDDTARSAPPGLEDSYDFLNELRRSEGSTTWLAYDRATHRDVIVTHVHPSTSPGPAAGGAVPRALLAQIGADAQLLAAHRHPAAVPVLASHWLRDGSLAVVRPRVRGTTLRQTLHATGALPLDRTVALLREIGDVLEWGRRTGIAHRGLTADSVCFQQGASRALVAFGPALALEAASGAAPPPVDGAPAHDQVLQPVYARCSDTATLGRLAWEMLTTRPAPAEGITGAMTRRGYREPGLADLRPDLPLSVAAEVESALRCERDASPNGAAAFIAALAAATGASPASGARAAAAAPVAPVSPVAPMARVADAERPVRVNVEAPPAPPAAPARHGGLGVMAFTVAAVLLLVGAFFFMNRDDDRGHRMARRADTGSAAVASGDVEFDPARVDTGVLVTPRASATPTAPMPQPTPPTFPGGGAGSDAPTVFSPRAGAPGALPPPEPTPMPAPSDDPCDSLLNADQQRCLQQRIGESDVELNRTYQELTRALREDPAAVAELRGRQRDWLARRDAECRGGVQKGTVWAPGVAQCIAERSSERTRELQAELERVRP